MDNELYWRELNQEWVMPGKHMHCMCEYTWNNVQRCHISFHYHMTHARCCYGYGHGSSPINIWLPVAHHRHHCSYMDTLEGNNIAHYIWSVLCAKRHHPDPACRSLSFQNSFVWMTENEYVSLAPCSLRCVCLESYTYSMYIIQHKIIITIVSFEKPENSKIDNVCYI